MKIGIVGLPNVGKSTLFQALTKQQVDTSNYPFATIDPNVGVVAVPDERLQKLALLSNSKKIVPAIVEFVDIAGLVRGASEGEGLGNKFLSHIREVDAICHIVRSFENDNIVHVSGKPNPQGDFEIIKAELALKDLETVTKAKQGAEKETKAGGKEAVDKFHNLETLKKLLETGAPTNTLELSNGIQKIARELQLLSFKPVLTVFNISESKNLQTFENKNSITIDIAQERDLSTMTNEEQKELGLTSKLPELIRTAYKLLNLITFFTTGEDETRAWTIPRGSTAKRAGGAIHSDFEDKFIRADVIDWQKLLEARGWSKARELGLLRSEGKEYIVQDVDVIEFKI
mgnify:FL=1